MSLRLWTVGSNGEIVPPPYVFRGHSAGVSLEDGPNYLLSNTYPRTLGVNLPRGEVLLGLAASMECGLSRFSKEQFLRIKFKVEYPKLKF